MELIFILGQIPLYFVSVFLLRLGLGRVDRDQLVGLLFILFPFIGYLFFTIGLIVALVFKISNSDWFNNLIDKFLDFVNGDK